MPDWVSRSEVDWLRLAKAVLGRRIEHECGVELKGRARAEELRIKFVNATANSTHTTTYFSGYLWRSTWVLSGCYKLYNQPASRCAYIIKQSDMCMW